MEAEEDALTYLSMPKSHWPKIRTNNVQERANREIKRRYRVVQSFPSRASLIRLVGAALIEAEDEWSARCAISAPSLASVWKPQAKEPLSEEGSESVRAKAAAIVEEAMLL